MPMWQKKIHSLSFWFSQEQRLTRRWASWASCTAGPSSSSSAVGLRMETVDAAEEEKGEEEVRHEPPPDWLEEQDPAAGQLAGLGSSDWLEGI